MKTIEQTTLLPENTAIQERPVNIKVLTVGTKQVTQALYHQLVEEQLFDKNAQIQGNVWGWVNLHTSCSSNKDQHLHAIYEREGSLKRCCVFASHSNSSDYKQLQKRLDHAGEAYVYAVALEGHGFTSNGKPCMGTPLRFKVKEGIKSIEVYPFNSVYELWKLRDDVKRYRKELNEAEQDETALYSLELAKGRLDRGLKSLAGVETEVLRRLAECSEDKDLPTSELAWTHFEHTVDEIANFEKAWKQSFQKLQSADQLFIAVSGVWK